MDFLSIIFIFIVIGLIILWGWLRYIQPYFKTDEIHRNLAKHPRKDFIFTTERLLKNLYQNINPEQISLRNRKQLNLDQDAFICGEINFLSFFNLLEKVNPQPGEIFYDLGSASGKAVLAAALFFDFSKLVGIEILPDLTALAKSQVTKITYLIPNYYPQNYSLYLKKISGVQFISDNFLNCDFSDGDIFFINATCLSYSTWEKLTAKLRAIKSGSRILVTSKKLPHDQFTFHEQHFVLMSWGMCSVNLYSK